MTSCFEFDCCGSCSLFEFTKKPNKSIERLLLYQMWIGKQFLTVKITFRKHTEHILYFSLSYRQPRGRIFGIKKII